MKLANEADKVPLSWLKVESKVSKVADIKD